MRDHSVVYTGDNSSFDVAPALLPSRAPEMTYTLFSAPRESESLVVLPANTCVREFRNSGILSMFGVLKLLGN